MKAKLSLKDLRLVYYPPESGYDNARIDLELDGVKIVSMWEDGGMRMWDGDFFAMMNGGL